MSIIQSYLTELNHLDIQENDTALFQKLAEYTDWGTDHQEVDFLKALMPYYEKLEKRIGHEWIVTFLYNKGNLYATLHQYEEAKNNLWSWELPYLEKSIFCFRQSLLKLHELNSYKHFPLLPELLINLANQLSTLGRSFEAIALWELAYEAKPDFHMAIANSASGMLSTSHSLYDEGHAVLYRYLAWERLQTLDLDQLTEYHPFAADKAYKNMLSLNDYFQDVDLDDIEANIHESFSMGDSEAEQSFRYWCLEHRLFINPLNDIVQEPIAAQDVMTAPSHQVKLAQGPYLVSVFNALKQSYITARFLIYESEERLTPEFADKDTCLMQTTDQQIYSIHLEKLKLAFRALYSFFDQLAYAINTYFELGVPEKTVCFRNVWYINGELRKNPKLNPKIEGIANWNLRGLFWLSKDFFDKDFQDVMAPEAKQRDALRNALEHRHLKIYMFNLPGSHEIQFGESITQEALYASTFSLLKLSRAALMYFSLLIHREETQKPDLKPHFAVKGQLIPDDHKH